VRYLVVLLVGSLALTLAVTGCHRTVTTSTVPPTSTPTTLSQEPYKEAYNILWLTLRVQAILEIAQSIESFDYPDIDALQTRIEAERQALADLMPQDPSPEYRAVNDAMVAALADLWGACTYKARFDADRADLESYIKLKQLADDALVGVLSKGQELDALLARIGHSPFQLP
jgi:hypothetical protein